jgi:hypothetical protein
MHKTFFSLPFFFFFFFLKKETIFAKLLRRKSANNSINMKIGQKNPLPTGNEFAPFILSSYL